MKIKLLLAFTLLTVLQSCSKSADTLTDNQIDSKLRHTIKVKNDSLFQAMIKSDAASLKQLGSPYFIKYMHSKVGNDLAIRAFRRGALDLKTNTVLHEYHIKHDKAPDNNVLEAEKEGYTFSFMNNEKETYVCMIKSKFNTTDDYLIITMYGLVDGQWKLNDIKIGFYGVYDKNAQNFYNMAEKAKDDDYIIDAFMYYDAANNLKSPIGEMIKYKWGDDAKKYAKLMQMIVAKKYTFPQTLDKIKSQPIVENIAPSKNARGLYPIITYRTFVAVEDTVALKKEYEQVKAEVKKIYTGLNFERDFTYYRAYNKYSEDVYLFEDRRK